MNSAATVPEAPVINTPEEVIDWNTFYNNYGREHYSDWVDADPDHWFTKVANWFTGDVDKARNLYDAYLTNINNRNEAKSTQSARAWDEYMSNTAYSRAFADLERAGVNPYLLLNNGSSPSTSVGAASKPSYSYSKSSNKDSSGSGKGRDFALILLAIARLAAILA